MTLRSSLTCCGSNCKEDLTAQVHSAFKEQVNTYGLKREAKSGQGETARVHEPRTVMVRCSQGHWCVYTRREGGGSADFWAIATEAEVAEFQSLQKLVGPTTSLDRLDTFGRWLFTSVMVFGSLGAVYGGASLAALPGWGRLALGLAILAVGISLGLATYALAPKKQYSVDPNSPDDMASVAYDMILVRGKCLHGSAILFAIGLVCFSLAPLVSRLFGPPHGSRVDVSYSIVRDTLSAEIGGHGLRPGTTVAAALRFSVADSTILAAQGQQVASESGQLSLKFVAPIPRSSLGATIQVTCPGGSGGCDSSSVDVSPLPQAAPPRAAAVPGAPRQSRRR